MAFQLRGKNQSTSLIWFYKIDREKHPNTPIVLQNMECTTYASIDELIRYEKFDNKKRMKRQEEDAKAFYKFKGEIEEKLEQVKKEGMEKMQPDDSVRGD